jgi:hypothetical protein
MQLFRDEIEVQVVNQISWQIPTLVNLVKIANVLLKQNGKEPIPNDWLLNLEDHMKSVVSILILVLPALPEIVYVFLVPYFVSILIFSCSFVTILYQELKYIKL